METKITDVKKAMEEFSVFEISLHNFSEYHHPVRFYHNICLLLFVMRAFSGVDFNVTMSR